jgi:hypothetical protein
MPCGLDTRLFKTNNEMPIRVKCAGHVNPPGLPIDSILRRRIGYRHRDSTRMMRMRICVRPERALAARMASDVIQRPATMCPRARHAAGNGDKKSRREKMRLLSSPSFP